MKRILVAAAAIAALTASTTIASANPHPEWHKGGQIGHDDWGRGQAVDYRSHHLRSPPHGYEWRQVDGNYVLAAVATGLILSTIVADH